MNISRNKHKILVVEDEVIVAQDISETLTELGYEVVKNVLSESQAINACKTYSPDLVLMDIMLKGKSDGTKVGKRIFDEFDIPIIYLTAYSGEKILDNAKLSRPYGYIVKPFDKTSLYTTIEIALYKYNFERNLVDETENALATIIGCTEVLLEEADSKLNHNQIKKIDIIRNSARIIKEVIEKL